MNERIKELAIKAGLLSADYNGFDSNRLTKSEEKFAELIVRECAELVDRAIREALAEQPAKQQKSTLANVEPHCYMDEYGNVHGSYEDWMESEGGWFPVYKSPQRKPWVGLDASDYCGQSEEWCDGALAAEAKLKEKNT